MKNAVVTGGAGDIGKALVQSLIDAEYRVIAVDNDRHKLEALKVEINSDRLHTKKINIADEKDVVDFFGKESQFSVFGLDLLVNGAGIMLREAPHDTSLDQWRSVMSVNLDGAFLCSREAGRIMIAQGRGSIINITSIAATKSLDRRLAYCTSKAGLAHMTRVLASEWAAFGVRVNAIAPGHILTSMNADLRMDQDLALKMITAVPMGRMGAADELAGTVLYLASEASQYVTGQIIAVDGGILTR